VKLDAASDPNNCKEHQRYAVKMQATSKRQDQAYLRNLENYQMSETTEKQRFMDLIDYHNYQVEEARH